MIIDMGNGSNNDIELYFGWQQKPGVNFNQSLVFFTNVSGQQKEVCDVSQGMVLDTTQLKTGWQCGETNKWQFNQAVSKMQPKPGSTWKKGFSIPVALGGGKVALWMTSGASAWDILGYLGAQLAQCPVAGHVPLVTHEGNQEGRYETRTWIYPLLKVQQWMPLPESLSKRTEIDMAASPDANTARLMPVPPSPGMTSNGAAPAAPPAPQPAPPNNTTFF